MIRRSIETVVCALVIGGAGCATEAIPSQLVTAQQAYNRAKAGPAAQLAPQQLDEARLSLNAAQTAFLQDNNTAQTNDLAYVAQRKAELAEQTARLQQAEQQKQQAMMEAERARAEALATQQKQPTVEELEKRIEDEVARREAELAQMRQQLAVGQQMSAADQQRVQAELAQREGQLSELRHQLAIERQRTEQERAGREHAEQTANSALEQLRTFAVITEEGRGTVITLSGSVIFPFGQSTLIPLAQERLDKVALALKMAPPNTRFLVEGYTDSVGPPDVNTTLSVERARAVRDYLASHGVPADSIETAGMGEAHPVSSNATPEGRADNRRVEIVILKAAR